MVCINIHRACSPQLRWILLDDSSVSIYVWVPIVGTVPLSSPALTLALTTQASSKHRLAVTTDHQWHLERNGCSYNITVDLGKILGSKRIALSFIAMLSPSFSLIHPLSYPNLA